MSRSTLIRVGLVLLIVSCTFFAERLKRLKANAAYQAVVSLVTESPELRSELGPELALGTFPTGSVDHEGDEARFAVTVSGPAGDARVHARLTVVDHYWRIIEAHARTPDGRVRMLVSADLDRLRTGQQHVVRAHALHVNGRDLEALAEFDRAIELDSMNATAFFWRGWTHTALDDLEAAALDFRKAVELDPEDDHAHYSLGVTYGRLGDYRGSLAHLDRAIEMSEQNGRYYFARAVTRGRLGRDADAERDLETACEHGYTDGCDALERRGRRGR